MFALFLFYFCIFKKTTERADFIFIEFIEKIIVLELYKILITVKN